MHYMKDIGGIIPIAARIADAYRDIFQNHKSIFVLERLMRDKTWFNRSVAVFAIVSVHSCDIQLRLFLACLQADLLEMAIAKR